MQKIFQAIFNVLNCFAARPQRNGEFPLVTVQDLNATFGK